MQGAVDRSDVYKSVELSLDRLISEHLNLVLAAGREIRKAEIGEEAAADEERRGNIPDEQYAKDAADRREARERQKKLDEARKRKEEEKEHLRAEAIKKEVELERLRREDERRRERRAREEQLRQDRKKRADEETERRKRDEERRRGQVGGDSSFQPPREETKSRQPSIERALPAGKGSPLLSSSLAEENVVTPSNSKPAIDEKAIEEAALEELLRESRELAAKSSSKPQLERSQSLEPPYRKAHALKSRSSNISPHKSTDLRQPVGAEPIKPLLSFSSTNVSRDSTTQVGPTPSQRTRSRSPTSSHHNRPDYRSRFPYHSHWDEANNRAASVEEKNPQKSATIPGRDSEVGYHKGQAREANYHGHSLNQEDTRRKDPSKYSNGEDRFGDRDDRSRQDHRDGDGDKHQATHDSRLTSHGYRERDYDRDREKRRDQDRDYHRDGRDRRNDRSRSPHKSSDHRRHYDETPSTRSGHRTMSPVDIDRYVPAGSSRAEEADGKEKHRHREHEYGSREARHRHRDADPRDEGYRRQDVVARDERRRDRDSGRDGRDEGRYRERRDDRDGSRSKHIERDRDRDRRERERDYGREKDRRDDGRDRARDKDRREAGHERDRGKGYVEIDRYVPSGR